jgi:uncharacterized membrane protein YfcA
MDLSPAGWCVAAFAVLLTGISKGGFGGALGGIAVPLMAIWMSPTTAAALMLPMLCLMDLAGLRAYWRQGSWPELRTLLVGAVIGIVLGALAFGLMPETVVKLCVGAIAVLFALQRLYVRFSKRAPGHASLKSGVFWGSLAGFTSTLAHAGGPPVLLYMFARPLTKQQFVATVSVFFAATNAAKLVPYVALHLFSLPVLKICLLLAPLAPVGVWLGVWLQRRVPEKTFFALATALLGLSGLQLIYDALR